MTDYIEKKVYDFDERFSPLPAKYMSLIRPFLRTALQEALLKGLEMAEDAVEGFNDGCGCCMTENAGKVLAALKKEVMEGTE